MWPISGKQRAVRGSKNLFKADNGHSKNLIPEPSLYHNIKTNTMKTSKQISLVFGSFFIMVLSAQTSLAQTFNVNKTGSTVKVEGTSNIHDWEINAEDFNGNLDVEMKDGQIVKINQLNFTVVAESLKSGKGGMDKNTYKALKTDKNKSITYKMNKVNNIDCTTTSSCKISTSGTLNVAGSQKPVDIVFNAKVTGDKITLNGNQTIKMTNFNVDPPTAMFGTITTGDEVKITFQTTFSK